MGFLTGLQLGSEFGVPHYYIEDGICTDCEACEQGLDVGFAMDYTGSMGSIIESVKSSIDDIAETIDSLVDPSNAYRLSLQLTDEKATNDGGTNWYGGASYINSGVYTGLPAAQKYVNVGTAPATYTGALSGYVPWQYLTTMEPFANNNLVSFKAQLAKTNNNTSPNMSLGQGILGAEPYDVSIDKMVDGEIGVGAWRKGVGRIGITFADNVPSGDDDSYTSVDQSFIYNDLSSKCRINNIRWMRFGNGATHSSWNRLTTRTDGEGNNSYNKSVVIAAIIAACGRGEVPYRMVDANGDLKTNEFTPYSWDTKVDGITGPHYLEITDHNDFTINPSNGITFSLWIKPGELTSQKLLYKTGEYEIGTDGNDKLFFSITTNNGTLKIITPTSPLVTNNWQHLLCTWDGTFSDTDGMQIYWAAGSATGAGASHTVYNVPDGNADDDSTGSTGTSITNTSNNIFCGPNVVGAVTQTLLSDVAIYKNRLSSSQAALVLNNGRPGNLHNLWNDIDVDWLVGYWRPFTPDTVEVSSGVCTVYGWESKNATFRGTGTSTGWSTDVPSSLGQ